MRSLNIIQIIFVSLLLSSCKYYSYKVPYSENNGFEKYITSNRISFDEKRDTTFLKQYYKSYENGQILRKNFYNDSLWLDSVHFFHYNGSVSTSVIYSYKKKKDTSKNEYYISDLGIKTFYENGNLRGKEYLVYTRIDNLHFHYKCFYDLSNEPIYEEIYAFGDTVKGTFLKYEDYPKTNFQVYDNGRLIETWYISCVNEDEIKISKIVLHTQKKSLKNKLQIKKKIKKSPALYFGYNCSNLIFANSSGRNFSKSIRYVLEYEP